MFTTFKDNNVFDDNESYIISRRILPPFPSEPNHIVKDSATELDMYLGRILEYSCPGQMIDRIKYSAITYSINGVDFLSEICRNANDIRDKTKQFEFIAKELGWELKSVIRKDISLSNKRGLLKRFTNDFEGELKEKMTQILKGEIEEFEWKNKEDLKKIKDIKRFVTVKGNKVKVIQ